MSASLPSLRVTGAAEREVVPDEVVVSVVIATARVPTAREALERCAAARGRVREALARVPDAEVADARVTTAPEHEHVEEPDARGRVSHRSVLVGYRGRCLLSARGALGLAGALMEAAGTHPDVTSARPAFRLSRPLARRVARELEQEAVRDALIRADGLARAAGMRAGDVMEIGEPPAGPGWTSYEPRGAVAHSAAGPDDGVEGELGELVPEPELHTGAISVTVALLPGD